MKNTTKIKIGSLMVYLGGFTIGFFNGAVMPSLGCVLTALGAILIGNGLEYLKDE